MNFEWNEEKRSIKESKNDFIVFTSIVDGVKVMSHVYITPALKKLNEKRFVNIRFFICGNDKGFVEKHFYEISNDVFGLCKEYNPACLLLNISFNECYLVKELPEYFPYTFGDYINV